MIVLRTELTTLKSYHPTVGNKSCGVSHTLGERSEESVITVIKICSCLYGPGSTTALGIYWRPPSLR